ncbi:uncharacterized protein J4E79_004914 [Alternaria viburni]|uniref:uncharacterized protein n=1 Tax=Alternaria viburni TaxID=566460 RepID=UPI0020C4D512|nr:uncharacterized protein J4E79_004914 [Alternaria viburni]KAI4661104.1 hypothetical protein J4E79_004914 [Alternaria viburni]
MNTTNIAPVVWINGFPGCGKLTIASVMKTLHTDMILLDNHQLIDPVEAKFQRSHPDYQKERHRYRQHIFREYSDNALGQKVAEEYREAARQAGRPFKPVYILCDVEENIRRVAAAGRVDGGTKKLTDPERLRGFRERCDIFRFDGCDGLSLDTTDSTPEEVAREILRFLEER